MTAKNSNFHPPFRLRTATFSRRLAICAALSAAAWLGVAASAQADSSPAPARRVLRRPLQRPRIQTSDPTAPLPGTSITKLMASNTLRPLDLGIWVHDGTATLTGNVATEDLRAQAESMVKSVAGVQNVEDKITIGAEPAAAPGFSSQNGNGANAVHPGDAQGPPPPPRLPDMARIKVRLRQLDTTQSKWSSTSAEYSAHPMPSTVTVAPGTLAYVMVMQPIDSKHTKIGTPFHGILVRDIVEQNGVIAIPRGADVIGTVVDARGPGKLKGHPQLALQLTGVDRCQ